MRPPLSLGSVAPGLLLALALARPAAGQSAENHQKIRYPGPPVWQQAAVATLNRHLPSDSGYFVLGPLDREVDVPDTTRLVRTTLRILAPDPRASRSLARRLWVPTGGVALEELQPSDTLPHEPPAGYPGRFLKGTIVGEPVYVQALTVQEHRWLLWAERTLLSLSEAPVAARRGPLARYSQAVRRYLAAIDSGSAVAGPPTADRFDLEPVFDLFREPPDPVIRERAGYLELFESNRAFALRDHVNDVYGVIPSPSLVEWIAARAEPVLFPNRDGEPLLQRRYRDYVAAGGRWSGLPILDASSLARLRPGRYHYAVDRYGVIRVGPTSAGPAQVGPEATPALLMHNDPVRVAGELLIVADPRGEARVSEVNIRSEEYFFSNRVLSIYSDVEEHSDDYLIAVGHLLRALDARGIATDDLLVRKF